VRILSTPDGVADALPGYPPPSARRYLSIPAGDDDGELRVHLVDAGDPSAPPVVFLHGNPSWSYIWRHQIAAVVAAGYRAIAPDLVGMGLSDKPSELGDYTVARHVAWMRSLLFDALDLHDLTFVLHDWGGIIGLRLVGEQPDRVRAVAISNTGLPTRDPDEPLPDVIEASGPFAGVQAFVRDVPRWEPWTMLAGMMVTPPSEALADAYHAPYPDPALTIGSRAFTHLLPTRPDNPMLPDNFLTWQALERFDKPVVTIYSDKDIVAPTGHQAIRARIPGAAGQPHVVLEGGGHFLQEDVPERYSETLVAWLASIA
jgi:haloalkane dehalogenase